MGSKFHELLQPTTIRDLAGQAVDGTAWLHQFLKVTVFNPADPGNREGMSTRLSRAGKREWVPRGAFWCRGSPTGSVYRIIGFPVSMSFLHAMQYSPRPSWNVMLDPAWHQGHVMASLCFATRMARSSVPAPAVDGGPRGDHGISYGTPPGFISLPSHK